VALPLFWKAIIMVKVIQDFLVRYLESLGVRIRYGNGDRPFVQVVQYIDDEDWHYKTEVWLDTVAHLIKGEIGRPK
jgi:hypothetical protein